ncbi:MAG: SAM-dependent chlorinase/fluorinase [Candidatus Bathyarchaeia archaeon]
MLNATDVSHPRPSGASRADLISRFNIRHGAYVLAESAPYFPRGTVHVAVVDPGVGR